MALCRSGDGCWRPLCPHGRSGPRRTARWPRVWTTLAALEEQILHAPAPRMAGQGKETVGEVLSQDRWNCQEWSQTFAAHRSNVRVPPRLGPFPVFGTIATHCAHLQKIHETCGTITHTLLWKMFFCCSMLGAKCVVLVPLANKSFICFSVVLPGTLVFVQSTVIDGSMPLFRSAGCRLLVLFEDFQLSSAYLAVVAVALFFNQDHFCPTAPSITDRTMAYFSTYANCDMSAA